MTVTRLDDHRSASAGSSSVPRQPPVSMEAEQALLGAILTNGEAFHTAAALVRADHFSEEIHRRIFHVAGELAHAGRPITYVGLLSHLGNHPVSETVDTQQYLARLAANATTVLGAPEYARIVRDMATRREVIVAAEQLAEAAFGAPVDQAPEDLAADALGRLRAVVEVAPRKRTTFALGQGFASMIERIERIRNGEERPRVTSTGFPDLDRVMEGGLRPSTIVLVAGRPGAGKTVLMTNLAFAIAKRGIGVMEFSLEVPDEEIKARHAAQVIYSPRHPVTYSAIEQATGLDDFDYERIIEAERDLRSLPLMIECPPSITAHEIAARIHVEKKRLAARGIELGVVLIDYLDKISASDRYAGQRTYEVQEIVTALKSAARAEEVCIVLLAQLNRGTEGREDKRPSLADIKSSSFLEQEAHAVIFIYREAYYLQRTPDFRNGQPEARARFEEVKNNLELILGKNRSGPETTVHMFCDVACSVLASKGRW